MKGHICIQLFWIPNSFCTFHDYASGGTPFLASPDDPSLIFYHSDFWTTFLQWKTELSWNFSLCWNIFYLSGLLSNLCLPWKTECALNSLYLIYTFYHSEFWTTCACPEKQNLPWKFSLYEIFFIFQDFWATWAWPVNRVFPEFFNLGERQAPPPRTPLVNGNIFCSSYHVLFCFQGQNLVLSIGEKWVKCF